jgi:putative isomerase
MDAFDTSVLPWSMPGSWLQLRERTVAGHEGRRVILESVRRATWKKTNAGRFVPALYEILLFDDLDNELPYTAVASPWNCQLRWKGGSVEVVFADATTLLFRSDDPRVRLRFVAQGRDGWRFNESGASVTVYDFDARLTHQFRAHAPTQLQLIPRLIAQPTHHHFSPENQSPNAADVLVCGTDDQGPSLVLRSTPTERPVDLAMVPSFEQSRGVRRAAVDAWMSRMPAMNAEHGKTAELAWWMLCNHMVSPEGPIRRPAVLMSRQWMNQIWGWDACFNAMALAHGDVELAWNQLLLHFDHQADSGMLPDHLNDAEVACGYTKPPVQGIAIQQIVRIAGLEASLPKLREIYQPLGRWTRWWLDQRRRRGSPLCHYMHGNDSGWDNSTPFDGGGQVVGTDLATYLVLQLETLADIARWVGRNEDVQGWTQLAGAQLEALQERAIVDGRFVSRPTGDAVRTSSSSLLDRLPILLGKRLPARVRDNLIADLSPGGPFLTEWGLATERLDSPHYLVDGYWRGPIWAPPTYLIFLGLRDAGATDLARTIAERFCRMCVEHPGLHENYDALSGKGLRCATYSWTAAVFVLLAHWLHQNPSGTQAHRARVGGVLR